MSFKTWQAMARAELANAFADIERRQAQRRADLTLRRILIVGAAALVTIGFWGTVMAVDHRYGQVASVLVCVAGLVLAQRAGTGAAPGASWTLRCGVPQKPVSSARSRISIASSRSSKPRSGARRRKGQGQGCRPALRRYLFDSMLRSAQKTA